MKIELKMKTSKIKALKHSRLIRRLFYGIFFVIFISLAVKADYPRVDQDIAQYDKNVKTMNEEFNKIDPDPQNKEWVKDKLQLMANLDQYTRAYFVVPKEHEYNSSEENYFFSNMLARMKKVDRKNVADLKELIRIYSWFRISVFGAAADINAWLVVQHADFDYNFQSSVLADLDSLYKIGESSPGNYAYLYDRVAASWADLTRRKLQRYGTQGTCVAIGKWEPIPIEDAVNVDARRNSMGLSPMKEYIESFNSICR
jgi:hypothetical protein